MPFIGRDWRSPGDQWVRTENGWEKLRLWRVRVLKNLHENLLERFIRLAMSDETFLDQDVHPDQPHIQFKKGITRESRVLTSLSESFIQLDMTGAVKDIRRFNYIWKVMYILLMDNFATMSGCAQKNLIAVLREMVNSALKSNLNVPATKNLTNTTIDILHERHYHHLGSDSLWQGHRHGVDTMRQKLGQHQYPQRVDDGGLLLTDLPEDCVRCILDKLSDHCDVINTGLANKSYQMMTTSSALWKNLCLFHFNHRQMMVFLPQELTKGEENIDWKYIFRRCVKRFGRKDVYGDFIALCCYCDNLFWQSIGHPCIYSDKKPSARALSPEEFVSLFNL